MDQHETILPIAIGQWMLQVPVYDVVCNAFHNFVLCKNDENTIDDVYSFGLVLYDG